MAIFRVCKKFMITIMELLKPIKKALKEEKLLYLILMFKDMK